MTCVFFTLFFTTAYICIRAVSILCMYWTRKFFNCWAFSIQKQLIMVGVQYIELDFTQHYTSLVISKSWNKTAVRMPLYPAVRIYFTPFRKAKTVFKELFPLNSAQCKSGLWSKAGYYGARSVHAYLPIYNITCALFMSLH